MEKVLSDRLQFIISDYSNKNLSDDDIIQYQINVGGLHPHNELIWRFINSEYYNPNKLIGSREKNKKSLENLESSIKSKGVDNLIRSDLLSYLDILNSQLAIELNGRSMYIRHGLCHSLNADDVIQTIQSVEGLNERNEIMDWDGISLNWRNLISYSWKLYEMGAAIFSIKMIEPVYNTLSIFTRKNIEINILDLPSIDLLRMRSSLSWILAMSYYQIGNRERYLKILNDLIDSPSRKRRGSYRINTRHLEASIRIYEYEKNDETLKSSYSILDDSISNTPTENMESVMERCIVMYDFLCKNMDYEKV